MPLYSLCCIFGTTKVVPQSNHMESFLCFPPSLSQLLKLYKRNLFSASSPLNKQCQTTYRHFVDRLYSQHSASLWSYGPCNMATRQLWKYRQDSIFINNATVIQVRTYSDCDTITQVTVLSVSLHYNTYWGTWGWGVSIVRVVKLVSNMEHILFWIHSANTL